MYVIIHTKSFFIHVCKAIKNYILMFDKHQYYERGKYADKASRAAIQKEHFPASSEYRDGNSFQ